MRHTSTTSNSRSAFGLFILFCFLCGCSSGEQPTQNSGGAAAKSISLRPNVRPDQSFKLVFESDQNVMQELNGQATNIKVNVGMGMTLTGVEIEGPDTGIRIEYDWTRFTQDHPQMKVDFDSRKPETAGHPMAKGFASIVGEGFVLVLDASGQPTAVRGVDELLANVTKKLDLSAEDPERAEIARQGLEKHFSQAGLLSTFRQTFGFYPPEPIAVGESWERTFEMGPSAGLSIANRWTLLSVEDKLAKIAVTSQITSPNQQPAEGEEGPVTQKITGSQEGTLNVDLDSGMPMTAHLTQDLEGTVSVKAGGKITAPVTVPIKIASAITINTTPAP